ncbi:MAG: serine hydrolase domain-containing protein, partial [Candidatus Kariarchaeaceae archaeon]
MNRIQVLGIGIILIVGIGTAGIFIIFDPFNFINPNDQTNQTDNDIDDPIDPPDSTNQTNGNINQTSTFTGNNFTAYEWDYSTPWEQGFSNTTFTNMEIFVPDGTKSIIVVRNGHIVYEKYYSGSNDTQHHIYSVTKSIVSILIGIAIDYGFINSTNDKVMDFFPNKTIENVDDRKERMTLYHLLTMTHGIDWEELAYPYGDSRNSFSQMWPHSDWTSYFLDLPMIHEPGTQFEYSTAASHTLSAIIEQSTGMKTNVFAEKYLFNPLGIKTSDITWLTDGSGTYEGGRGLHIITKDMAKIGHLYLENGS